uniref:Uncharacterized protein n=1 Tax=Leersia perrieri TaxID=77586 RepID=A0A0D9WUI9_9ORYZ
MIPSTAAPRRSTCPCYRRRRRNVAAGSRRPPPVVGSSATARALAAGLWRLRQAERSAARRQHNPATIHGGRKAKQMSDCGVGRRNSSSHGNDILDKIEACCMVDEYSYGYGYGGSTSMEKATKWDNNLNNSNNRGSSSSGEKVSRRVVALEAALEKARCQMRELDEERRLAVKKLRKVAEEKAWWKSKARCAAAALREELKAERHHRRQLEAANGKLMKEVASAKQRVETERKARELMEEACEELSKEVEEDQAEVEALRRECVAMREEMEEERRMLQMAEVWREERVQMKLSDAKAVLEHKYAHLNTLQSEMESFLHRHGHRHAHHLRRTAALVMPDDDQHHFLYKSNHAPEDVDKVFDHFRRKNNNTNTRSSSSPASSDVASPATDLFLEKVDADDGGGWPWERETPPPPNHRAINASTSSNNGVVTNEGGSGRSRRSGNFNTALIRRLWRSAISESRKKQNAAAAAPASSSSGSRNRSVVMHNGCSSSYSESDRGRNRDRDTARSSVINPAEGARRSASATSKEKEEKDMGRKKKSLMEKLMEARMDDHQHSTDQPQQVVSNTS